MHEILKEMNVVENPYDIEDNKIYSSYDGQLSIGGARAGYDVYEFDNYYILREISLYEDEPTRYTLWPKDDFSLTDIMGEYEDEPSNINDELLTLDTVLRTIDEIDDGEYDNNEDPLFDWCMYDYNGWIWCERKDAWVSVQNVNDYMWERQREIGR